MTRLLWSNRDDFIIQLRIAVFVLIMCSNLCICFRVAGSLYPLPSELCSLWKWMSQNICWFIKKSVKKKKTFEYGKVSTFILWVSTVWLKEITLLCLYAHCRKVKIDFELKKKLYWGNMPIIKRKLLPRNF